MTDNKRNISIDMVRGILIVCVVMGHYRSDSLHDILYMFHMPLFFIISGFLLNKDKLLVDGYLRNKAETLLIPYAIYIFLHFLLVKREYSLKGIVKVLWGGRLFNGTYWYITCFLFTLFLLALLLKKEYANKKTVALILAGGGYSGNRIKSCKICKFDKITGDSMESGCSLISASVCCNRILWESSS